jgi:hypothetical protein
MLVIGISSYPIQSTKEVVKRFMELPRLPDYIKGKGAYGYTTEKGAKAIMIYEFDSAKAEEAIDEITMSYWRLYDIPGHNFEIRPCTKARDAAKRFLEVV